MMLNRKTYLAVAATLVFGRPLLVDAADPAPPQPNAVLSGQQIEQALQHPVATTRGFATRGLSRRDTAEHDNR